MALYSNNLGMEPMYNLARLETDKALRALARIYWPLGPPIHPVWQRCSSVTYRGVCALLAPCQTGASTLEVGQLILARALSSIIKTTIVTNAMWPAFVPMKNVFFGCICAANMSSPSSSSLSSLKSQLSGFPSPPRYRKAVDLTTDTPTSCMRWK
jgi:hypothetical protein